MTTFPGDILWVDFGAGSGREQTGRRPAVVVSGHDYLRVADSLVIVVPVTSKSRGWVNHVPLEGVTALDRPSFAMTEQPRTISRQRVVGATGGGVSADCLQTIRRYLSYFLDS